jgi:MFS family permease
MKYLQHFRGFNRNVRLFLIGNVLFQIGLGVFMVIYNLYIQEIGYQTSMNGTIISITSIATVLALLPAGIFSDRIGRRPVFLIGVLLEFLSLVVRSLAEGEILLLITAFLNGFFFCFCSSNGSSFFGGEFQFRAENPLIQHEFFLKHICTIDWKSRWRIFHGLLS